MDAIRGDRGHDGDLARIHDGEHGCRIDRGHVPDEAEIDLLAVHDRAAARSGEQSIRFAGNGLGEGPVLIDEGRDLRPDLGGQHIPHHFEGFGARDTQSAAELAVDAAPREFCRNLWTSTVHHDGANADLAEVDHVLCEGALQLLVHHGVAAEFHHDRLALVAPQPGKRFDQRCGFRRCFTAVSAHQLEYALFSCT